MAAYLTPAQFKDRTIIQPARLDEIEVRHPGWIANQLLFQSDWLNSLLGKRYAVPFAAMPDTPPTVLLWLAALVTPLCYLKAGIAATDEQFSAVQGMAEQAQKQVHEAADCATGLFELPLRAGGAQGVTRRRTRAYTEISPYTWRDLQRDAGRREDGGL